MDASFSQDETFNRISDVADFTLAVEVSGGFEPDFETEDLPTSVSCASLVNSNLLFSSKP